MSVSIAAIARSTHPGPTLAVTTITVVLGLGLGMPGGTLVLLGLAMLCDQLSVGLSNDARDAERDRLSGRSDKPVSDGRVPLRLAWVLAGALAVVALALTVPFGWRALLAHAVFLGSAWSYNLWLKATVFSLAPYVVSFGILPLLVTLSQPEPTAAAPWAIAAGALLGAAAHFANVLPDIDDDVRSGVRGLPHRLGHRASLIICFAVLATATIVLTIAPASQVTAIRWVLLAIGMLLVVVGLALSLRRAASRRPFQLVMVVAALDVLLLLGSGQDIAV